MIMPNARMKLLEEFMTDDIQNEIPNEFHDMEFIVERLEDGAKSEILNDELLSSYFIDHQWYGIFYNLDLASMFINMLASFGTDGMNTIELYFTDKNDKHLADLVLGPIKNPNESKHRQPTKNPPKKKITKTKKNRRD
jgi:hypothetical protein